MIDLMIETNPRTVAVVLAYKPPLDWEASHNQAIVRALEQRLGHPVVWCDIGMIDANSIDGVIDSEDASDLLQSHFEKFAVDRVERIVILPFGRGALPWSYLRDAVSWGLLQSWCDAQDGCDEFSRAKQNSASLPVCYFAEPWSIRDWSDLLWGAIHACSESTKTPILLIGDGCNSPAESDAGEELVQLSHWLLQACGGERFVHYAYTDRLFPGLGKTLDSVAASDPKEICIVVWGDRHKLNCRAIDRCLEKAGWGGAPSHRSAMPWIAGLNRSVAGQPIDVMSTMEAESIFIEKYHDALGRIPERVDDSIGAGPWRYALWHLRTEQTSLLPDEYRETLDEVSPVSMGSASLLYDEFGRVAWDKIWTSFCDLAMAGGPPHRGKLLEAVSSYEAALDLDSYEKVLSEIERGIGLVTGLGVVRSETLGWVGVQCDNEAMAVWLLRAIIVENVMVRREGSVLYLPAGPKFTVKREIKNVITSVAKSVHYWRAHLRSRKL